MTDTPTFDALGLDERLLASLDSLGFETPTPVQAAAIPPLLEGRDVIGRARTGSGKTAAYGLPLLQKISEGGNHVRSIVLAPTRELALQVTEALRELCRHLPIRLVCIYGGASYVPQLKALQRGVPLVVGTPGRILDHMERGSLDLSRVEFLVLDEADEMLRMGFVEAVEEVVSACPPDRQVALLSATMPNDIKRIAKGYMNDPLELSLQDDGPRVDHIEQSWIRVPQRRKLEALQRLLAVGPPGATLVFARTRRGCAEVADALVNQGVAAEALHGDLNQSARERVVSRLRAGGLSVVIATDVAARGIDVDHIGRVINLDLPDDVETYVHRIGRTARAGREGEAITLVTSSQRKRLGHIAKVLKTEIKKGQVPGDHDIAHHQRGSLARHLEGIDDELLDHAESWIAELTADGWTLEEIASAAVHRLAEARQVDLGPPPPPPEESASVAAPAKVASGPEVQVFLSLGDRHGVRPADVVGALTNEVGFPPDIIGRIDIQHRKTFVGLPEEAAQHLLKSFPSIQLRGNDARVDLARGHGGSPPGGGHRHPFKGGKDKRAGRGPNRRHKGGRGGPHRGKRRR